VADSGEVLLTVVVVGSFPALCKQLVSFLLRLQVVDACRDKLVKLGCDFLTLCLHVLLLCLSGDRAYVLVSLEQLIRVNFEHCGHLLLEVRA